MVKIEVLSRRVAAAVAGLGIAAMAAAGFDPAGAAEGEQFLPPAESDGVFHAAGSQPGGGGPVPEENTAVTVDYEERQGPTSAHVWVYEDPDGGLCEPVPADAVELEFTLAGGTGQAVEGFVPTVLRDGFCISYQAGGDPERRVFYRANFDRGCIVVETEGDAHGAVGDCAVRPSVVFEGGISQIIERQPPETTTSTSTPDVSVPPVTAPPATVPPTVPPSTTPGPTVPETSTTSSTSAPQPPSTLPKTGDDSGDTALYGLALIAAGVGFVAVSRRRLTT